jgi:hypothetical protein
VIRKGVSLKKNVNRFASGEVMQVEFEAYSTLHFMCQMALEIGTSPITFTVALAVGK